MSGDPRVLDDQILQRSLCAARRDDSVSQPKARSSSPRPPRGSSRDVARA
jgi:hypothetical protein